MWPLFALASLALAQETVVQQSGDALAFTGASGTPEYYVVQPGDTLWDISSKFLGNPYYWPRLWSINEQITNPHWIYPGNRVRFTLGTVLEPPEVGLETGGRDGYTVESLDYGVSDAECGPNVHFDTDVPSALYSAPGFLAYAEDVDVLGSVPKARNRNTHLSEGDLLYLSMDDPEAYDCGDVLMIFRPIAKQVRHPQERKEKLGSLYRIVGEVKVVHRYGNYVSAVVRSSYSEIERGDMVGPSLPVALEVEAHPPKGDVSGTIVARLTTEATLAATGETVFLDRGRSDGLRVGNSFYVVEQRDEKLDYKEEDTELPPTVIGRLVVVRVDEDTSTAVVTDASHPIDVGQRVAQTVE